MRTTIRIPAPSARPPKIRSPSRTLAPFEGLVEMGSGDGKGEAMTSPDPAPVGFGVVTVIPWSVMSSANPSSLRWWLLASPLRNCVDGLEQTLLEAVGQRDETGLRQRRLA